MTINITLEEALSKASPRLAELMRYSVDLLTKSEKLALRYHPDGFHLAFSGGKDSQALIHMAQLAGVKFTAHFSPSSIDPPENIRFIKRNYPEVQFSKLEKSIFDVFKRHKTLPSMKIRWCCKEFKEHHGAGRVTLTGVRNAESVKRASRREVEVTNRKFSGNLEGFGQWSAEQVEKKLKKAKKQDTQFDQFSHHEEQMVACVGGKDRIVVSPIIHWTDKDVWEFLNKVVEVPHCELYDQGWTRIGCVCCPMATTKNTLRDVERWPHVKEKWIKAIMEIRKEAMLNSTPPTRQQPFQEQPRDTCPPFKVPLLCRGGFIPTPPPTATEGSLQQPDAGASERCAVSETISQWGGQSASQKLPPPPTHTGTEGAQSPFPAAPTRNARPLGQHTMSKQKERSLKTSLIGG